MTHFQHGEIFSLSMNSWRPRLIHPHPVLFLSSERHGAKEWGWPLSPNKGAAPLASPYKDIMVTCCLLGFSVNLWGMSKLFPVLCCSQRRAKCDDTCGILFGDFDTLMRNRSQHIRDVKAVAGLDERMTFIWDYSSPDSKAGRESHNKQKELRKSPAFTALQSSQCVSNEGE